jgi:glycosyltransferase involved in cell wall biosynthesis
MTEPYFSIVIPTKDRPQFLRYALESVKCQTYQNYECIIVNNSDQEKETKKIFTKMVLDDSRFIYVRPGVRLPMHENWEYGISKSSGEYVSILIDKVLLLPDCLELASNYIRQSHKTPEVLSWWSDAYDFHHEEENQQGYYRPFWEFRFPSIVSAQAELKRRINFTKPRSQDGYLYFRGKICFGIYHRNLINKIKSKTNLFERFSPDYTSLTAALCAANKVHDMGRVGCLSLNSRLSNGRSCEGSAQKSIDFIKQTDPNLNVLNELPIRGRFESVHNFVARDYLAIISVFKNKKFKITRKNLRLRVYEDIKNKKISKNIMSQKKYLFFLIWKKIELIFDEYFLRKIFRKTMLSFFSIIYTPGRFADELEHRKFCLQEHKCNSPLDALKKAHEHYQSFDSIKL